MTLRVLLPALLLWASLPPEVCKVMCDGARASEAASQHAGMSGAAPGAPCHAARAAAPVSENESGRAPHECAACLESLELARFAAPDAAPASAANAALAHAARRAPARASAFAVHAGARSFARARHGPGAFDDLPLRL